MRNYLVERILDKYERSYKNKQDILSGFLSINLMKDKKYLSDKDDEFKNIVNEIALTLSRQGLLKIKWYDHNNIIERVLFSVEDIDSFYLLSKRKRNEQFVDELLEQLRVAKMQVNQSWMIIFFDKQIEKIEKDKQPYAVIKDDIRRKHIVKALIGIDEIIKNDIYLFERIFSKRYLHDSKIFEKELRSIVLGIYKQYNLNVNSMLSDMELLEELNIEKTSSELFIKGSVVLEIEGKEVDLSLFTYGIGFSNQMLRKTSIKSINNYEIISFENKANYMRSCETIKDTILIFKGSFYNPIQRNFLKGFIFFNIRGYFHSGDLDFNGFNIFKHLEDHVFPALEPYLMDVKTYRQYLSYGEIKSKQYLNKMSKMLEDERFSVFFDLIKEIIENKKILEQEIFLT